MMSHPIRLIVLISGSGSNLQALIDAIESEKLTAKIQAVISDNPNAYGLERAKKHNIPTKIISKNDYPNQALFESSLSDYLDDHQLDLIILAGFMRILSKAFVERYKNKILNIHPSLLPKYPGLHTHQQVLKNGDSTHGCSVHIVTADLDAGPILAQAQCAVKQGDNQEKLKEKIHVLEHQLYTTVIQWFAAGRINISTDKVFLDQQEIPPSGIMCKFPELSG